MYRSILDDLFIEKGIFKRQQRAIFKKNLRQTIVLNVKVVKLKITSNGRYIFVF